VSDRLTARERDRLIDLLGKFAGSDDADSSDRDAIGMLIASLEVTP
jgi:hypothetical protein